MEIRELRPSEAAAAAMLLSRGMLDNPNHVIAWGSDAENRQRSLARFFSSVLRGLFVRGSALGAFDGATLMGVCGMAPPGRCQPSGVEKLRIIPSLLIGNTPMVPIRVLRWVGEWTRHDPGRAHWHLGPVAVDAHLKGRGIGGGLMAAFCARMDEAGAEAYLETDKEENVAFYQKYGFRLDSESEVLGIPNWYMTRAPEKRTLPQEIVSN